MEKLNLTEEKNPVKLLSACQKPGAQVKLCADM
jgi:hypothetical protein